MNAAELDTRITIETQKQNTNAMGGVVETWEKHCSVWAKVKHMKGGELVDSHHISSVASTKITIRFSSDVESLSSSDRILHRGIYYDIVAPPIFIPGGRPEKIEILTKALR